MESPNSVSRLMRRQNYNQTCAARPLMTKRQLTGKGKYYLFSYFKLCTPTTSHFESFHFRFLRICYSVQILQLLSTFSAELLQIVSQT